MVAIDNHGGTWTLDVCDNTWEEVTTKGARVSGRPPLVYDYVSDLTYAMSVPAVHTFDTETSTWTSVPDSPNPPEFDPTIRSLFVLDQANRVIYGFQGPGPKEFYAYDIAANTWTELAQSPSQLSTGQVSTLVAFDPTIDRIVLYFEPFASGPTQRETWTFDPNSETWEQVATETPAFNFGWWAMGTEMAYDEASRNSVVFADASVAAFDAITNEWTVAKPTTNWPTGSTEGALREQFGPLYFSPLARLHHALVDDPVNDRVIVLGGSVRTYTEWEEGTDAWAYDPSANAWIELVPQQRN